MEVESFMLAIVKHCEPQAAGKHGPGFGRKAVWWKLKQNELARKVSRLLACEEELLALRIPVLSWAVTGTWERPFHLGIIFNPRTGISISSCLRRRVGNASWFSESGCRVSRRLLGHTCDYHEYFIHGLGCAGRKRRQTMGAGDEPTIGGATQTKPPPCSWDPNNVFFLCGESEVEVKVRRGCPWELF